MESIPRDNIVNHLTNHSLIKSTQHGFMAKSSCATNLLKFLEKITKIFDEGDPLDIVYLDLAKANDKVPHQRLLNKMRSLGIEGNIVRWAESWLKNRRQRTVLNGCYSDWLEVISGVPQGSVLGPLLFVVIIKDINNCSEQISILLKFADDTKVANRVSTADEREQLQSCLDKLVDWANTWCMKFNTEKCKVLHLGRSNPLQSYTMEGSPLADIDKERDIGVIISSSLKPTLQCIEAAWRASAVLPQISKSFLYRNRKVFLQLYKQFVRCHLEFAVPAWSPWADGDIDLLEHVQRRVVNLISGLAGRTYKEKLREIGMSALVERRIKYDLVQTYKILNGIDNVDFSIWFKLVGQTTCIQTRNTAYERNLLFSTARTDVRKHLFSMRVVSVWNALPRT